MPLAPAIAAALTTPAARTWGLFVDGLDVSKEPGAAPRYGTVWPSIALRIAAPGGASSMEWDVDDQAGLLAFVEGQEVRLVRLGQTNRGGAVDAPWFRGTVEVATATALGIGRQWHVRATGLDAIPDWTVTDYPVIVSVAGGAQDLAWVVQSIVAACSNRGDIGAIVGPSLQGTVIWPTGALGGPAGGAVSLAAAFTIPAGTTMRRAVEMAAGQAIDTGSGLAAPPVRFTIDMYGGVRLYTFDSPIVTPDGNVTIGPLTPLGAGDLAPADDTYTRDGTTVVRQAIVNGAGGVRGVASDGTGRRGRTAITTDTNLTTVAQCQAAAAAYLVAHQATVRGRVRQESIAAGAEATQVLYKLNLTDNPLGSTGVYEVGGMDVEFDAAGLPSITYTYGGRLPTFADLVRRMAGQPLQA